MGSAQMPGRFDSSTAQWISRNADQILDMYPEPSNEPWRFGDDGIPPFNDYKSFNEAAKFHRVLRIETHRPADKSDYQIDADAYARAEYTVADRDNCLPCMHSGLVTVSTDPYRYQCSTESCSRVFDRETAERTFG